jgi:glycosyltransferase involved in cell wall biosynthesis
MRTLLATHLVPFPPDSGGKAVTWQTLACLSRLGPVDMCAFTAPWETRDGIGHVQEVARTVATLPLERRSPAIWMPLNAARGIPYYVMRDYSRPMERRIHELLKDGYDLVLADSLHMAPYFVQARGPKVLQQHNIESHLVREFLSRGGGLVPGWLRGAELRNLEVFEREQCNGFDAVVVLSDADRTRLRDLGVRVPVMVVPPAVDPVDPVPDGPERRSIVCIGTQHWLPAADGMRWYLEKVHPLIRREAPGVEVILAGARPPRDIAAADGRDGVRVLGHVGDLDPVYRSAAAFIVPLRVGGGVRLKILHALARGLAVVSTSVGCDGLALRANRHLLVADEPDAFASAVLALLRDPVLRGRLGEQGRAHVLQHFSLDRRCARLQVVAHAVTSKTRPDFTQKRIPVGALEHS